MAEQVGLSGHFELQPDRTRGQTLRLLFQGQCIAASKGRSARRNRLDKAVAERLSIPVLKLIEPVKRVALVTSENSEAPEDFQNALWGDTVDVRLIAVKLNDAQSIANGITQAARQISDVDLMVVTRGGGSPIDLMPFDSLPVIEAVHAAARVMPTLVAVGHAGDQSSADAVASYTATTPTAAGHFVSKHNQKTSRESRQVHTLNTRGKAESARPRRFRKNWLGRPLRILMLMAWSLLCLLTAFQLHQWLATADFSSIKCQTLCQYPPSSETAPPPKRPTHP